MAPVFCGIAHDGGEVGFGWLLLASPTAARQLVSEFGRLELELKCQRRETGVRANSRRWLTAREVVAFKHQ